MSGFLCLHFGGERAALTASSGREAPAFELAIIAIFDAARTMFGVNDFLSRAAVVGLELFNLRLFIGLFFHRSFFVALAIFKVL